MHTLHTHSHTNQFESFEPVCGRREATTKPIMAAGNGDGDDENDSTTASPTKMVVASRPWGRCREISQTEIAAISRKSLNRKATNKFAAQMFAWARNMVCVCMSVCHGCLVARARFSSMPTLFFVFHCCLAGNRTHCLHANTQTPEHKHALPPVNTFRPQTLEMRYVKVLIIKL